jgi:acyl-CoA synthetase (AMP-forming)/AMP-acid ligase II
LGAVVHARVTLKSPEDPAALRERLRRHCALKLARYKVPVKIDIAPDSFMSGRGKKLRGDRAGAEG